MTYSTKELRANRSVHPVALELRRFRRARGLTQAELGAMLGIDPNTLCRYETGKRQPSERTRAQLLRFLDRWTRASDLRQLAKAGRGSPCPHPDDPATFVQVCPGVPHTHS